MSLVAGQPVEAETLNTDLEEKIHDTLKPGQLIAYSQETTTSSTFTTTNTEIGSVTADLVEGCTYLVECPAQMTSSVNTDVVQASLFEDSTAGTEMMSARDIANSVDQTRPVIFRLRALYIATATESKTFVVVGVRAGGSGNVRRTADTTFPQLLTVTLVDVP